MQNDRKRLTVEVDEVAGIGVRSEALHVWLELREWQAELMLVDLARLLGREKTQEVLEANL
jgi:hypothetical protein